MTLHDVSRPLHLRFFVSSPSDVAEERKIACKLIDELARKHAFRGRITTQFVAWDDALASTPMDATTTPQDMVNRYCGRPADCDLTIVILWSRLGTRLPKAFCKLDGSPYESGTIWEMDDAKQGGKQVWLYRRQGEPVVSLLDPDHSKKVDDFNAVAQFFATFTSSTGTLVGGYNNYNDPADLEKRLAQHLEAFARERLDVQLAELVATEKGVPASSLRPILALLGEDNVPDEKIPERLARQANELIALRKQLASHPDSEQTSQRVQALTLIDKGQYDQALQTLQEARDAARHQREASAATEAALLGDEAKIAHLRLRYRDSSELYAQAAELVRFDPSACAKYIGKQAGILRSQGEESSENTALQMAISIHRKQLACIAKDSLDWAEAQNDLGVTLLRLGERESNVENLEASLEAFECALTLRNRKQVPLDWADTQNNLGLALAALGERDSGTAKFLSSVAAYRSALEEYTRERAPLDWAMVQNNLGNALWRLGERESDCGRLLEAVEAFRRALEEYTRERAALDWAMVQNNLGNALATLAERESSTTRLVEAVDAFRAALLERTRERVPPAWALTLNNLGCTLTTLGERERSAASLVEAVEAHRAALVVNSRQHLPLDWALTQTNLGLALTALGKHSNDRATLLEAVKAYHCALEVYTLGGHPRDWAETQRNLGAALEALAVHEGEAERLLEARDAYRAALQVHTRSDSPLDWTATQGHLSRVEGALALRD